MLNEITLAEGGVPGNEQSQSRSEGRGSLIEQSELARLSSRLEYNFLVQRNFAEAFFSGPYSISFDRLMSRQLESENPSLLHKVTKILSENPISSVLCTSCLTILPSAVTCLVARREDLVYSYFIPSSVFALTFLAITAVAPSIQRYLNNGDNYLRQLRQLQISDAITSNIFVENPTDLTQTQAETQAPSLRSDAQGNRRGADGQNDLILAGVSTFLSARPPEQEVRMGSQNTSAEAQLVFSSSVQLSQALEARRPSDQLSSTMAVSAQGLPRNLGPNLV